MLNLVSLGEEDFLSRQSLAADILPIAISRGRVNPVDDVRGLVTRELMLLDR